MRKDRNQKLLERWEPVVKQVACFLGLAQTWSIRLDITDLENSYTGGYTKHPPGYKTADIRLNGRNLVQQDDTDIHHIIVHELLHLVFAPLDDCLQGMFGEDGEIYKQLVHHMETVIDTVARHLVDLGIIKQAQEEWERR